MKRTACFTFLATAATVGLALTATSATARPNGRPLPGVGYWEPEFDVSRIPGDLPSITPPTGGTTPDGAPGSVPGSGNPSGVPGTDQTPGGGVPDHGGQPLPLDPPFGGGGGHDGGPGGETPPIDEFPPNDYPAGDGPPNDHPPGDGGYGTPPSYGPPPGGSFPPSQWQKQFGKTKFSLPGPPQQQQKFQPPRYGPPPGGTFPPSQWQGRYGKTKRPSPQQEYPLHRPK